MASGVQNAWSATALTNATADTAINLRENQSPSTYNNAVRAVMTAIAKWVADWQGGLVTTGTASAFALTTNEGLTLANGKRVSCRINITSGAAPTLNVDGTGAVAIQTVQGTAPAIGALLAGGIYTFTYYAASAAWIMQGHVGKIVGEVFDFAGATAPPLSLLCYGQAISRSTYAALFAAISTTYGVGDGTTTFNLPDCRGRVVAGQDDMGGVSANRLTALTGGVDGDTLGAVGGEEAHTLLTAAMPAHSHSVTDPGHTHTASTTAPAFADNSSNDTIEGGDDYTRNAGGVTVNSNTTGVSIQSTGGGGAHNNVQPTLILNKCIFAGA